MGKNQHQKDRMHITSTEWRRDFGGFKERRIPRVIPLSFDCCSITLRPFKNPVCSNKGHVFDKKDILIYLKKYKKCPVDGKPLFLKDLTDLKFHKNSKGKFHCPLTYKIFNEHSHIVAIKPSGNVYSFEAVCKLNIVPNNWFDILTGEKFVKKDIITIQNPHNLQKRTISNFDHITNKISINDDLEINLKDHQKNLQQNSILRHTVDSIVKPNQSANQTKIPQNEFFDGKRLPKFFTKTKKSDQSSIKTKKSGLKSTKNHQKQFSKIHTDSQMSASFTSTAVIPDCNRKMRLLTDNEKRQDIYRKIKQREECYAFVRLHTTQGDMNFALNVRYAPQTCHSFLSLAEKGYYDNTIFHRLIPGFMVQGGDPEGTGFGGECAFGGKMKDEICKAIKHDSRGILSMANSGPNTNGSQFFITFGECSHLDGKHTVFGKLVGGMEYLNRIEMIKTDKQTDQPKTPILLKKITIFSDPFKLDFNEKKVNNIFDKSQSDDDQKEEKGKWFSGDFNSTQNEQNKVGKYLKNILNK